MSFFNKFKASSSTSSQAANLAQAKKDAAAPQPTALEKHLIDAVGPVRADGSDKFFGFENYGSTCYANSIIQCLYYSAPFREHVISFPNRTETHDASRPKSGTANGQPYSPKHTSITPYPNPTSPARKPIAPTSPTPGAAKPEESKDSPEYKKRMAIQAGPVLSMTHDSSEHYGMQESLFTSLRDIFDSIIGSSSRVGVVSPHRFLEILRRDNEMFRSAMHQDAHEFLNYLLNQVVDEVELFVKQNPNFANRLQNGDSRAAISSEASELSNAPSMPLDARWVHDIFEGRLTSETRCLSCETTSQRDEPFLDLSVDLSAHSSVTACLRKFSEEEMLCERNKFHCDTCGGLQEAEKRMKIKRLPKVLALHLKRFKYDEDYTAQARLHKLFHRVVYPFHLRLFDTTDDAEDPDRLYELYAVVVHIGGGPYHGHYVSIVKTQDRGWLLYDDEMVEPVDESFVLNFFGGEPVPGSNDPRQLACAYVLFYQETTMENVLREQALAHQPASSGVSTTRDVRISDDRGVNGLQQIHTVTTPLAEEGEPPIGEVLAHATTAPGILSPSNGLYASPPERPAFSHMPTSPIFANAPGIIRSRKEQKEEEKARKGAFKGDNKISEDGEAAEKESGLARFKHGSMSLRGSKPRLFGSNAAAKEKENSKIYSSSPLTPSRDTSAAEDFASTTTDSTSAASRSHLGEGGSSSTIGSQLSASLPGPTPPLPILTKVETSSTTAAPGSPRNEDARPSWMAMRKSSRRSPFSLGGHHRDSKSASGPTSAPSDSHPPFSPTSPTTSMPFSSPMNGEHAEETDVPTALPEYLPSAGSPVSSPIARGAHRASSSSALTHEAFAAATLKSEEKEKEKEKSSPAASLRSRFSISRKKSSALAQS